MSEQTAIAQPEPSAPEATAVADTTSAAPVTQDQIDRAKDTSDFESVLGAIFDKHNAPPEAAKPEAKQVSDQPESVAAEPAQSSPAIAAPHSWSAEYQGKWGTLPPDVQKYIADRESQAHTKITQTGNELKTYQPLRQSLDAFRQYYAPGQEQQFVHSLMQANAALHHDPVGTLRALAEYYNVDPAQLAGQRQPQQQAPTDSVDDLFRDSRLDKQVLPLVQAMSQELKQMRSQLTAREQAEAAERQSDASKAIAEFSKDKPDFAELQDEIAREANIIRQAEPRIPMEKLLERAYDRARWANPEIRQRILTAEKAAEAEKAKQEAIKKAAEAKKHQSMNVRTGAAAPTPSKSTPWHDEASLSALFDQITSRG